MKPNSRWWRTLREKAYLTRLISFVSLYLPACSVHIYFKYGKMIAVFNGYQQNPLKGYGRKLNIANSRRIIVFYKFNLSKYSLFAFELFLS